jgi:hypothetical protein
VTAMEDDPEHDEPDVLEAEYQTVAGSLLRLAESYEESYATAPGVLRWAARLLVLATPHLPRGDRCKLPTCDEVVEQADTGRPKEFCTDQHRWRYARLYGKQPAPAETRRIRRKRGRLPRRTD